jgi:stage II sporulation SpoAA-like protein
VIHAELDRRKGLLIVAPEGPLTADDFRSVAKLVDPYIEERALLRGLLVRAPAFPGWESFGALIEHMKFVRDHHRDIERVAAVTDSDFLRIAPAIAQHFLGPEIRVFPSSQEAEALAWLQSDS